MGNNLTIEQNCIRPELSLVIPCYEEADTLAASVRKCLCLKEHGINLEIIIVDDCSSDGSIQIARQMAQETECISVIEQPGNMGKGAALRQGFKKARGKYIGIHDADCEYEPLDYLKMLKPLQSGKADVVYGSRYLKTACRPVLFFWHSWMNRTLTFISNLFTNLDLTDMETCYKLFTHEALAGALPLLKENRFGFEPEITAIIARKKYRVWECAIQYHPRDYLAGKKIGWRDGLRALYCILHYGAPYAPLPMQLLLYFFIGMICALANLSLFCFFLSLSFSLFVSVTSAFCLAAALNYFLCISILFQHKARWRSFTEACVYIICVGIMCLIDYTITAGLVWLHVSPFWSKCWATLAGFIGNFLARKYIVF